jgi:hypothetical protein
VLNEPVDSEAPHDWYEKAVLCWNNFFCTTRSITKQERICLKILNGFIVSMPLGEPPLPLCAGIHDFSCGPWHPS